MTLYGMTKAFDLLTALVVVGVVVLGLVPRGVG